MADTPTPASVPPPSAALPQPITIEEVQKIQLRIGTITAAADHPNADRLLVLTVDVGEATPRQLVAGIKRSYQPQDLIGRQVVVVANLKSAHLRGVESQGMVLAASNDTDLVLVHPGRPIAPGSIVK